MIVFFKKVSICIFAYFSIINSASAGYFLNGNQLKLFCSAEANSTEQLKCLYYIIGVVDMDGRITGTKKMVCSPPNVPAEQYRDITIKYLNDNPQDLHLPAVILVLQSLLNAFPCKE